MQNPRIPIPDNLKETFNEYNGKLKQLQTSPKSMKDLQILLVNAGQTTRDSSEKKHLSPRTVADIVEKYVKFGLIIANDSEAEKARVSFYDLDAGIYRSSERTLEQLALYVERNLTIRQRKEFLGYMRLDAPSLKETKNKNLVVLGNGIFNRTTRQLEPFTSDYVFTSKVATKYNPQAKEPTFNGWTISKWFKQIAGGDKDKEKLLWQIIATVVNPNIAKEVAIFLVDNGQGRTGKSTFEQLLENLVGAGNYASLKLKEFEQDFKLASATGKALIVGDDNNPNDYNTTSENFKSVATGENVLINPKGITPFNYRFNSFIIQSMNGIPRFKDTSDALFRRFRVMVFDHQYPATASSKKIKDEYIKDQRLLEFALKKSLDLDFEMLQDTKESQRIINEIKLDNDSVRYFVENYLPDIKSTRVPVKFLFKLFLSAMDFENNPQSLKQNTFTRRAKPLMKGAGWEYSRNNLAPLELWSEKDLELLKKLDIHYKYSVDVSVNKKQPLFEKSNKTPKNATNEK